MRVNRRRFQRINERLVRETAARVAARKTIYLPLNTVVDFDDALGGLLLAFAILHQQTGDGGAERGLAGLQRKLNLRSRIFFVARGCEGEDAVDGVPELRQELVRDVLCSWVRDGGSECGFESHGVVQIGTDALELRRPGAERIRFVVI